jgi:WD repeat-containing protein 70
MTVYDSQAVYGPSHTKAIASIDMESGGGRFITGSQNGILALWDYGGMDSQLLPYRLLDPLTNGLALKVAALGKEAILVACGGESGSSGRMRLLQRSGSLECDCPSGDPYVMDQRVTRGHTQAVTGGLWSFTDPSNKFYTCGLDGTVRIWDRTRCSSKNEHVLVVNKVVAHGASRSNNQGAVTALALWPEDDSILVGTRSGSVKLYSPKGPWIRPIFSLDGGDLANEAISCVQVDPYDSNQFGVRVGDKLLIYDKRTLKTPIHNVSGFTTEDDGGGNFEFIGKAKVLVGTHTRKPVKNEQGKITSNSEGEAILVDFSSDSDRTVLWKSDKKGVTRVKYCDKLDQIILGHSDGSLTGIYNSNSPVQKGLLKALKKTPPKRDTVIDSSPQILNPEPVPFLTTLVGPQDLDYLNVPESEKKSRADFKPELPLQGEGRGGRIANSSNTQRILLQHAKIIGRDEDPREALFRVADRAEKDPLFVTPAYQETTQPDQQEDQKEPTSKKKLKISHN